MGIINQLTDTLETVRQWKIEHIESSAYKFGEIDARIELVDRNMNSIYEDFKQFSSNTAAGRWTKEDHQHYEILNEAKLAEIRENLQKIQDLTIRTTGDERHE